MLVPLSVILMKRTAWAGSNGTGIPTTVSTYAHCTLGKESEEANSGAGTDTIAFSVSGIITLSAGAPTTIAGITYVSVPRYGEVTIALYIDPEAAPEPAEVPFAPGSKAPSRKALLQSGTANGGTSGKN